MGAPEYRAPRWLANAHLQTIYGSLFAARPAVRYRRERWETPDDDFVDADHVDGPPGSPWVVLFHGLEGSSDSPYARTLMHRVAERGWRGTVVHFRGCSGEPNRLPRAYHSGDADELDWVLRRLRSLAGDAPVYATGISLGGNALLKWLGELGDEASPIVTRAAAVSAPLDLMAAGEALGQGFSIVYAKHFLATMKSRAAAKHARFPGSFDLQAMRGSRTLREFDNVVTAPLHGFRDTDDYWTRASSKPVLRQVVVPTLVLNARDDPFLPERALPAPQEVSAAIKVEFPDRGGHVAFVSGAFPGHIGWLPARLLHFFDHQE
ncbi:MAG: hydrolase [Betaproteobacteria bacterium]|nr:hydrolase [Betaproteobacteria bacterium]